MNDTTSNPPASVSLAQVHLRLGSIAGEVHILRGIDLRIAQAETVSVVGPSGSGKSSMLMVIAGLERASSGDVVVGGSDLSILNEDELALFRREKVGIVFQDFHLIPTMTALENVAIPLEFAGIDNAFERAAEGLKAVGLGHRTTHYPGQLSGGEQQRTALARALAPRPGILLADEPTGNLDSATGEQVVELMFGLTQDHGTTLMLITHDIALSQRCGRQVHLIDGQIAAAAQPA